MAIDYNKQRSTVARVLRQPVEIETAKYPYYPTDPETPVITSNPDAAWWESLPSWGYDGYEMRRDWEPTDWEKGLTSSQLDSVAALQGLSQELVFTKSGKTLQGSNYNNYSYTGVDMVPTMALPGSSPYVFGDISTMSVSSHRESFPVRILGKTNPMGFTHGPRTIAGSIIFAVLDMYPFYKMAQEVYAGAKNNPWDKTPAGAYPMADALPPFDITVTFNNEYENSGSILRIFGVVLIDDGMTLSIDDLVTENTYSFMAAGIAPLHRAKNWTVEA